MGGSTRRDALPSNKRPCTKSVTRTTPEASRCPGVELAGSSRRTVVAAAAAMKCAAMYACAALEHRSCWVGAPSASCSSDAARASNAECVRRRSERTSPAGKRATVDVWYPGPLQSLAMILARPRTVGLRDSAVVRASPQQRSHSRSWTPESVHDVIGRLRILNYNI